MKKYILILLAVLFIGLALLNDHQPLKWDFLTYAAASRSLRAGDGYRMMNGEPFVLWPPLYPTLLAAFPHPAPAAHAISALSAGATTLFAGIWLSKRVNSLLLLTTTLLSVLTITGYMSIYTRLWSEALYMALAMAFLLVIEQPRRWVLASILAALAIGQRYLGLVLIGVGVVELLADNRTLWGIGRAVKFTILPMLVFEVWSIRNQLLVGLWDGRRQPSQYDVFQNIHDAGLVLLELRYAITLILVVGMVEYACDWIVRRSHAADAHMQR